MSESDILVARLRARLRELSPGRATLVVLACDVRATLERLDELEHALKLAREDARQIRMFS